MKTSYTIDTLPYPRALGIKHIKEVELDKEFWIEQWVIPRGPKIKIFQTENFGDVPGNPERGVKPSMSNVQTLNVDQVVQYLDTDSHAWYWIGDQLSDYSNEVAPGYTKERGIKVIANYLKQVRKDIKEHLKGVVSSDILAQALEVLIKDYFTNNEPEDVQGLNDCLEMIKAAVNLSGNE